METLTDILSHSWRNVLSRELDEMQDRYRIRCSCDRLTLKGYNHRDLFVVRSRGEGLWQADRFKGWKWVFVRVTNGQITTAIWHNVFFTDKNNEKCCFHWFYKLLEMGLKGSKCQKW